MDNVLFWIVGTFVVVILPLIRFNKAFLWLWLERHINMCSPQNHASVMNRRVEIRCWLCDKVFIYDTVSNYIISHSQYCIYTIYIYILIYMHNNQYSYIDLIQSLTDSQVVFVASPGNSRKLCCPLRLLWCVGATAIATTEATQTVTAAVTCDSASYAEHTEIGKPGEILMKVVDFCLFFLAKVKWWWCQTELLKGQIRVDSGGIGHRVDVLFERHVVFLPPISWWKMTRCKFKACWSSSPSTTLPHMTYEIQNVAISARYDTNAVNQETYDILLM